MTNSELLTELEELKELLEDIQLEVMCAGEGLEELIGDE